MRRRQRQADKMPELMISPMLDLIFLLLAFFIISTMYMTEVRTISIALPSAQNAEVVHKGSSLVTVKKDGSYWLDDKKMPLDTIVAEAALMRIIPLSYVGRKKRLMTRSSTFSISLKHPVLRGLG